MTGRKAERSAQSELEVEATPEMIEAGADVVSGFFSEFVSYGSELSRLTAIAVYSAMERVRDGRGPEKR